MERIEKIRSIINNWRQKFKTVGKTKHITSRQANRKFINMLKGRRTINRWRKRRRRTTYHNPYPIIPTAPYISDGWHLAPPRMLTPTAPPTVDIAEVILNETPMPH